MIYIKKKIQSKFKMHMLMIYDYIMMNHVIWMNLFFFFFPFYFTSFPCLMMESLQHEKQNLCVWLLGHWTKCVSSSLPAQLVHLSIGFPSAPTSPSRTCPLLDEETWTSNLGLEEPRWNLKNLSRGLNPPKSAKTRFKFSGGLNLEFDTILSGTNHI